MKKTLMLATAALFAASVVLADAPKPAEQKTCDKAAACCKRDNCDAKDPAKCDRASCKAHKH